MPALVRGGSSKYRQLFVGCALFTLFATTNAFLFPDLGLRSGLNGPSYKIAVLEEEPYLFANGSGYVPELLEKMSGAYSRLNAGKELQLDIVPVRTWAQLILKARSTRAQVSFGLVIPSLSLSQNSPWKRFRSTVPAIHTTAKVVARSQGRDMDTVRSTQSGEIIVLKDSPLEHLLVNVDSYPGPIHSVDNQMSAINYLRSTADGSTAFVTDAISADTIAEKDSQNFRSVCVREIPGDHGMHFAFFGKDSTLLGQLNEALLSLTASEPERFLQDSPSVQCTGSTSSV